MERKCATCKYWVGTQIETDFTDLPPHLHKEAAMQFELVRASTALCSWPTESPDGRALMQAAPAWLDAVAGGGVLTSEDAWRDCRGWAARDELELGKATV